MNYTLIAAPIALSYVLAMEDSALELDASPISASLAIGALADAQRIYSLTVSFTIPGSTPQILSVTLD